MAANLGYSVALVERDTVGGTVVSNGGAPTKTFREAALYLGAFEKDKIYGISLAAPPEVMYPAVAARARAVSEILQRATLDRWCEGIAATLRWALRRRSVRKMDVYAGLFADDLDAVATRRDQAKRSADGDRRACQDVCVSESVSGRDFLRC